MTPLLFAAGTTQFNTNGVGSLPDATSCTVIEERNGQYELEMQYPITGAHYADIVLSSVIMAVPADGASRQPFRVYKLSKPINGIVTINAQHISYQLSYIPTMPFSASSAALALSGLKNNAAETCPFDFWTDISKAGNYKLTVPASIRSQFGGIDGSILDTYGGEYEWDGYTVKLHASRGADNGVTLRYGKNITDITQEQNISNTITGVCPYWSGTDGAIVTLPQKLLSATSVANYPYPRTVPLDLSSEFDAKPSEDDLRAKAQSYIDNNNIGSPAVSVSVSFVALWQTDEYKDIAPLERVKLCDTVTVDFAKLGVAVKAKVIKTVYNVLLDRYDSIDIGDAKSSLDSTIASTEQEVQEKTSTSYMQAAVDRSTAWITGANGGYVIMHKDANGQPYEILVMDTPDISTAQKVWRWNNSGLGYSSNGYNGPYGLAMTQDGAIVADFITAGALSANRVRAGLLESNDGDAYFDLDNGVLSSAMLTNGAKVSEAKVTTGGYYLYDENGNVTARLGAKQGSTSAMPNLVLGNDTNTFLGCGYISAFHKPGGTVKNYYEMSVGDGGLYMSITDTEHGGKGVFMSTLNSPANLVISGMKVILDNCTLFDGSVELSLKSCTDGSGRTITYLGA